MNRTVNSVYSREGRTPIEQITGETPDISEYTDFGFYDWVWYRDNGVFGENQLGRWLGVSHRIGPVMCYSILTDNCQVVTRTTVSCVTNLEKRVDLNRTLMAKFDDVVYDRLPDSKYTIIGLDEPIAWRQLADLDDPEYIAEHDKVFNDETVPEADSIAYTPDSVGDPYLNTEVALSVGPDEEPMVGRVVKRLKDNDGQPIGRANDDPRLDTRMYEVEYCDG
jgi:hypothetical protein